MQIHVNEVSRELDVDPDTNLWQRLRLMMLSLFVPESQL